MIVRAACPWPAAGAAWVVALCFGLLAGPVVGAQQACSDGKSSLPPERFQDNGDGTVTDMESKLMWMRCSGGQQWHGNRCVGAAGAYGWNAARQHAETISRDGGAFFADWRLPSLRELASITDRGCENPRTNLVGLSRHAFGAVLVVHPAPRRERG